FRKLLYPVWNRGVFIYLRWRIASYKTMPAETDTFKEAISPNIGILANLSEIRIRSSDTPTSSAPFTMLVGTVYSTSSMESFVFSVLTTICTPDSIRNRPVLDKESCRHTGILYNAPAEVLIASGLISAEPLRGTMSA